MDDEAIRSNNSHVDQPAALLVEHDRLDLRVFILPWYTVLICAVADQIVGGAFHGLFLTRVEQRFGAFVELLISYVIAAVTTLWYFGFVREMHAHVLDLGSYLGIGFCVVSIIRGLFIGDYRSWKEFKRSRYY